MVSVTKKGTWLHDPDNPSGTIEQFRYNAEGGRDSWEVEAEETHYAGRKFPVVEFGEHEEMQVDVDLSLEVETNEIERLKALAKSKKILLLRDNAGRLVYGYISSLPVQTRHFGGETRIIFRAVDYVGNE